MYIVYFFDKWNINTVDIEVVTAHTYNNSEGPRDLFAIPIAPRYMRSFRVVNGSWLGSGRRVVNWAFSRGRSNRWRKYNPIVNSRVKETSFFMRFFLEWNPSHVGYTVVYNLLMDILPFHCNQKVFIIITVPCVEIC